MYPLSTAELRSAGQPSPLSLRGRERFPNSASGHSNCETALRNAFPFDQFPRYLYGTRDAVFGQRFREQVRNIGIARVLSTPHSSWQRAYVEPMIGSIRRDCLDRAIVFESRVNFSREADCAASICLLKLFQPKHVCD